MQAYNVLTWTDYSVITATLFISVISASFFAFRKKSRNINSADDYLSAGGNLKIIPVAISSCAR